MLNPIFWVSIHRTHHQYVDSDKDSHSPTYGFWFSHIGWLFDTGYIVEKYKERKNVEDLKSQPFYRFIRRTYLYHILAFTVVVYAFGGFTYLVWLVVSFSFM
ncbi:putative acyl-CoA desaturase [Helianthus annuus]|nr:putative acyl-CoA desaturase [Helianthus annuus]